ncbi:MAG: S8 family serine peptidase [Nitrososphaeraceae archaeon]|nr:S8 family serine peptidase [Nitrososphaeraceae archaeon]
MDPLALTKLQGLMNLSRGIPEVSVGVIDGPLDLNHPTLHNSKIRTTKESGYFDCKKASSMSCMHGTFIAGMLVSERGPYTLGICPNCEIIIRPVFKEVLDGSNIYYPSVSTQDLARAIVEVVDSGAKIINLSLGLTGSSLIKFQELEEAYDYAFRKRVLVIAAAGNQGSIGHVSLIDHPWVIPVASCDANGNLDPTSNIGPSIAKRGLMAPGKDITSSQAGGTYMKLSGTSVAAPFITGTIALLYSIFYETTTPQDLVMAIRRDIRRRTLLPPLLNAERSIQVMEDLFSRRRDYVTTVT